MKKQSNLSQLMGYAGGHRYLTYLSLLLSAVSAVLALFPFVFLFSIIREVIDVSPNYAQASHILLPLYSSQKRKRPVHEPFLIQPVKPAQRLYIFLCGKIRNHNTPRHIIFPSVRFLNRWVKKYEGVTPGQLKSIMSGHS